mmetsp:Transcript_12767/g.28253  ORF Transcript_12767/g.28253 Transcript_12767/m.28253 type:complete len:92 (+) Transcript_12767:234-509(+)
MTDHPLPPPPPAPPRHGGGGGDGGGGGGGARMPLQGQYRPKSSSGPVAPKWQQVLLDDRAASQPPALRIMEEADSCCPAQVFSRAAAVEHL